MRCATTKAPKILIIKKEIKMNLKQEIGYTKKQKLLLDKIEQDVRDGKRNLSDLSGMLLFVIERRLKKESK